MLKAAKDPPRSLKALAAHLSPGFLALVDKLMQKNPARRFQTAQEVLAALTKLKAQDRKELAIPEKLEPGTETTRQVTTGLRRGLQRKKTAHAATRVPMPLILAGGGVGVVVLVLAMVVGTHSGSVKPSKPEPAAKDVQVSAAWASAYTRIEGDYAILQADPWTVNADCEAFLKNYPQTPKSEVVQGLAKAALERTAEIQKQWQEALEAADAAQAENSAAALNTAVSRLAQLAQTYPRSPQVAQSSSKTAALKEQLTKLAQSPETLPPNLPPVKPSAVAEDVPKTPKETAPLVSPAPEKKPDVADAQKVTEALAKAEKALRGPR